MGWILRTFRTRDKNSMLTLWKSLVRPILDYCCQLWSPVEKGLIRDIESLQRTFTSKINEVKHLDYWNRLRVLNLYSLERRRERYIILYIWKSMNNLSPSIGIGTKWRERSGLTCDIRRPPPHASRKIQSKFRASLRYRGSELFNILPPTLRSYRERNLGPFKRMLDEFLTTIPDQPKQPGYHMVAESNSLLEQSRTLQAARRRGVPPGCLAGQ